MVLLCVGFFIFFFFWFGFFILVDRKRCEKRRKCWLPTFFPALTFSKGFFLKVVDTFGLCGKRLILSRKLCFQHGKHSGKR